MPLHRRVLAIMGKAPRPGAVKSRLAARYTPSAVLALYRAMMEDTIDLARSLHNTSVAIVCRAGDAAEMRAWIGSEPPIIEQEGRDLADGLESAFASLIGAGFSRVIAFNGDTPHLGRPVLETAFEWLGTADIVIGPTEDGGYYLVGMSRPHRSLFTSSPLGTASAFDALFARAGELGLAVGLTPPCYDVDLPDDVARLARELGASPGRAPRTAAVLRAWPEWLATSRSRQEPSRPVSRDR